MRTLEWRAELNEATRHEGGGVPPADANFSVVSVRTRQHTDEEKEWMGAYAALTHQLGGEYVHLHGRSVATEVILGHRRRGRWLPGNTTGEVIRRLSGVDVHILRAEPAA